MSFIVSQKIKGRIYLYQVESYWDKDKKKSRQRRTYIGPKSGKDIRRCKKSYGWQPAESTFGVQT